MKCYHMHNKHLFSAVAMSSDGLCRRDRQKNAKSTITVADLFLQAMIDEKFYVYVCRRVRTSIIGLVSTAYCSKYMFCIKLAKKEIRIVEILKDPSHCLSGIWLGYTHRFRALNLLGSLPTFHLETRIPAPSVYNSNSDSWRNSGETEHKYHKMYSTAM
jgi:hypothetical protein